MTDCMDEKLLEKLRNMASRLAVPFQPLLDEQNQRNEKMIAQYQSLVFKASGGIAEFRFRASGNAKRKLLRRQLGVIERAPGSVTSRDAMSFNFLSYYSMLYDLTARECGAELVGWHILVSPLRPPKSLH